MCVFFLLQLCVDEAQMVESETTKASEMCMHITAENKWFVTGTPIQREISGEWIFVRYHMCMGSQCTYLSTCMYTYCTCACTYVHTPHVHMYSVCSTCTHVRTPHVHMYACTYSTCTHVCTPHVRMYSTCVCIDL